MEKSTQSTFIVQEIDIFEELYIYTRQTLVELQAISNIYEGYLDPI